MFRALGKSKIAFVLAILFFNANHFAVTLRYLQTLTEIAGEKNSTIVFPIPVELLTLLRTREPAGDDGEKHSV